MYVAPRGYRRPDVVGRAPRHRWLTWSLGVIAIASPFASGLSREFPVRVGGWQLYATVAQGRVVGWWAEAKKAPPPGVLAVEFAGDGLKSDWPELGRAGKLTTGVWSADLWYMSVPLWMVSCALWLAWMLVLMWCWPWGYCKRCGYNLRPISPLRPCPECGGMRTRS